MILEKDFSDKQKQMYELMSDMSEERTFAGWIGGNEMACWAAPTPELCALRDELNGWVIWVDEVYNTSINEDDYGPAFVSLEEWHELKKVWVCVPYAK